MSLKTRTTFLYSLMLFSFFLAAIVLTASASAPLDLEWQKHAGNPVLIKSESGWDSYEVYPGAVVTCGGEIKMWYLGRSSSNGAYSLGYASSIDGFSWNDRSGTPVMAKEDGASNLGPLSVVARNASFYMWYTSYIELGSRIGYAYSEDGKTWAMLQDKVILEGTQGSWDKGGVSSPVVIFDNGIYKMWYAGEAGLGRVRKIGYATSTDGITWHKQVETPVLENGEFRAWDDSGVFPTSVILSDGQYEMWYTGLSASPPIMRIGRATSTDGIRWEKDAANPILDVGSSGAWDNASVFRPMVLKLGSQYMMWYGGSSGATGAAIGLAINGPPAELPTPGPSSGPTPTYWHRLYLPVLMKMN